MRPTTLWTVHKCNSRPPPSALADAATPPRPRSRTNCAGTSSEPHNYIPVNYPASFFIDNSVAAGVPVLDGAIRHPSCDDPADCRFLVVVAYSEGAIVAEKVRRGLDPSQPDAPSKGGLRFVMIASPNVPNGGIFSRLPGLKIPFFVTSNGAAQPSPIRHHICDE